MIRWLAPVLLCAALAAGAAEPETVSAIGLARGFDSSARDRAVDQAAHTALLEVIERWVPTRRITPYEAILEEPNQYLEQIRIVDYDVTEGITTVEIRARVRGDELRRAVARAWREQAPEPPRVLVLVAMRHSDGPWVVNPDAPAQVQAEEIIARNAMEIVGIEVLLAFDDRDALEAMAEDPAAHARALARAHDCAAAVWLSATVTTEAAATGGNVHDATAAVTMTIVSAGPGAPLQESRTEALVSGLDPDETAEVAVANGCARLAARSGDTILLAAAAAEPGEEDVLVTIEAPLTAEQRDVLVDRFGAVAGVEEIEVLLHGSRATRIRVRFPGNPARFMEPALANLPRDLALEPALIVHREMRLRRSAAGER